MGRGVYKKTKLLYGVGINDADYVTQTYKIVEGKRKKDWTCKIYKTWSGMVERCYSERFKITRPSYENCSICEEWLSFSTFREWMVLQDYENKHLDKDLLSVDNKIYSPNTCIFVDVVLNNFITDRSNMRGDYLIGVVWHKRDNIYEASCNNPFTKNREYLGRFKTELEAHLAWKKRKHELACELAESEHCNDPRLAEALRTRYL